MATPAINVLFTSVGRRVELIQAFKNAYAELGLDGHLVGVDINPLAPALQVVDRPYLVPRLRDPNYLPTLVQLCEKEHIDLIFPLIDPDIPVLTQARATLEAAGARLVVVPPEAAAIASDKWLTYQFFQRLRVPTPRSWLPDAVPDTEPFPLFLKPRFGSASQHTYKIDGTRELEFFASYVDRPIVQEFLPGAEITNDVLCDFDGAVLAVVSRQRLEVRGGEVVKGVTLYNAAIIKECVKIAQHLPGVGVITVQCMLKDEQPFFTEINARFGGGLPLSIAAGVNSPKILLARRAGLEIAVPPLGEYTTDLYVSRFDSGYFLDEAQRHEMASRRL